MTQPKLREPWTAQRGLSDEDGYGYWTIYKRLMGEHGQDRGRVIVCSFNIQTRTEEVPEEVQFVLDAWNTRATDGSADTAEGGWAISIEGFAGLTNVLKDLARNPVQCVGEASLAALAKAHAEAQPLPAAPTKES